METFISASFFVQLINLLIVLVIIHFLFLKPYLAYIREQEKKEKEVAEIHGTLEGLKTSAQKEGQDIVVAAQVQAKNILSEAEIRAKNEASSIVSAAQTEAHHMRETVEARLKADRQDLERELQGKALDIAIRMNKKLLGNSEEANIQFLEKNI